MDWLQRLTLRIGAVLAGLSLAGGALASMPHRTEVRVVVVTTWESTRGGEDHGELHAWQARWPLSQALPFPVGVHSLQYDPKRHVLAILTGMATARAAASIMALGTDPRFDLSHAYWIVAGTAGVDPKIGSVGSAAWARWVVDGDLAQELDARDMPADWPTGILPYGRTRPYEQPAPNAHNADGNVAYALNPRLVDWAFSRTRNLTLPDDPALARLRAPYAGAGARPPFVLEGEGLMSARTWYGARMNDWAERWVDYWTGGKGQFAMSAEEDTGIMQALTFLARDRRVRLDRVLILRAASDYTVQPPGVTAADFVAQEASAGFPAEPQALDSLYRVGEPVARALADDWKHTRDVTPGGAP
ncbi:purine-nucleoside phosphorylase [Phenylobacterium montanum]|uniref:Purine nucleoside permease n=1 Tax=Phenylobacterium montanum TaxID=2823693 RepID=A0A975IW14_9CAUL|nr:purine nucleoside permease [Caulobacter sp. S6]QUD89388.1 purine nucleoside permease [Caulobacter sp. S6]